MARGPWSQGGALNELWTIHPGRIFPGGRLTRKPPSRTVRCYHAALAIATNPCFTRNFEAASRVFTSVHTGYVCFLCSRTKKTSTVNLNLTKFVSDVCPTKKYQIIRKKTTSSGSRHVPRKLEGLNIFQIRFDAKNVRYLSWT